MIEAETDLECRITSDPDWVDGALWGDPRPGHPEGAVLAHVLEVLSNVEQAATDASDRERLRLVALIHDTFKHQVNPYRPRVGDNHHALLARRFAERYVAGEELLDVIELHDEAYNAWAKGHRSGSWTSATERAQRLMDRLGPALKFYVRFYQADNETGGKAQEPLDWFLSLVGESRSSSDRLLVELPESQELNESVPPDH
jgi:hypothetical protein